MKASDDTDNIDTREEPKRYAAASNARCRFLLTGGVPLRGWIKPAAMQVRTHAAFERCVELVRCLHAGAATDGFGELLIRRRRMSAGCDRGRSGFW